MGSRIIFVIALLLAWAASAGPAQAHAVLEQSNPADGAILAQAPAAVVLRFSEPVSPVFATVLDATGRALTATSDVSSRDAEVRVALPATMADGSYVVSYRITSVDSHVVGGSLVFSVGSATGVARPAAEVRGNAWDPPVYAARLLLYLGLVLAAGAVFFHGIVAGDLGRLATADQRRIAIGGGLGIAAAVLGIGLEGADLAAATSSGLFDPDLWAAGAATGLGISLLIALIGLVLLLVGCSRMIASRPLALAGSILAAGSLCLSGHAATAEPRWLSAPLMAAHVVTAAFWLGSLWPLAAALRLPAPEAVMLLRRFSRLAVGAVGVLVAAGVGLAVIQLGSVAALWTSAYGIRLLVKLAFVALLLALAALNRTRLTPALAAGGGAAGRGLRTSIAAEIALGVAILAATASLGFAVPPRALSAPAAHGFSTEIHADDGRAAMRIFPAAAGRNTIEVQLSDHAGTPMAAESLTLQLAQPERGIEAITRTLQPISPGLYRLEGPELSLPGTWHLRIEALVSKFHESVFETDVPVR
jgi:copper transport protein